MHFLREVVFWLAVHCVRSSSILQRQLECSSLSLPKRNSRLLPPHTYLTWYHAPSTNTNTLKQGGVIRIILPAALFFTTKCTKLDHTSYLIEQDGPRRCWRSHAVTDFFFPGGEIATHPSVPCHEYITVRQRRVGANTRTASKTRGAAVHSRDVLRVVHAQSPLLFLCPFSSSLFTRRYPYWVRKRTHPFETDSTLRKVLENGPDGGA